VGGVIAGAMVPLLHSSKTTMAPPPSPAMGALSDAQLLELVTMQNGTLTQLAGVVAALRSSPDLASQIIVPRAGAAATAAAASAAAAAAGRELARPGPAYGPGEPPPRTSASKRFDPASAAARSKEAPRDGWQAAKSTKKVRLHRADRGSGGESAGGGDINSYSGGGDGGGGGGHGGKSGGRGGKSGKSSKVPRVMHGLNLVPPRDGLHADQDVTLASMRLAVATARREGTAHVTVLAVEAQGDADYPLPDESDHGGAGTAGEESGGRGGGGAGDNASAPSEALPAEPIFLRVKALRRTVFDAPHFPLYFNASAPRRPLPLLSDILAALYAASDESYEYLAFTNADIGLQPDFYEKAVTLVGNRGAVAINRVEVPEATAATASEPSRPLGPGDLAAILAAARATPQNHHGFDCFLWRRGLTPVLRLAVGNLVVGYPPIGNVFVDALKCASKRFEVIKGTHLTFHLGVKNGGWGLHRDMYEGYNRLSRKMAEATLVSLAEAHRRCDLATAKEAAGGGSGAADAMASCAGAAANSDRELQGHAMGHGALPKNWFGGTAPPSSSLQLPVYKRVPATRVLPACATLVRGLGFTAAAVAALDALRPSVEAKRRADALARGEPFGVPPAKPEPEPAAEGSEVRGAAAPSADESARGLAGLV